MRGVGIGLAFNAGRRSKLSPAGRSPLAWWRSDSQYIALDGSNNVSAWSDIVTGATISQATAGARPAYTVSDANFGGKPTLGFNGATSLAGATVSATQPNTIYAVARVVSSTANFIDTTGGTRQILGVNTGPVAYIYAGTVVSGPAAAYNATHAFAGSYNGASSKVYVDASASPTVVNPGANNLSGSMLINTFNGQIAEIIILAGQDSNAQVASMFAYLAGRYGGAWS